MDLITRRHIKIQSPAVALVMEALFKHMLNIAVSWTTPLSYSNKMTESLGYDRVWCSVHHNKKILRHPHLPMHVAVPQLPVVREKGFQGLVDCEIPPKAVAFDQWCLGDKGALMEPKQA